MAKQYRTASNTYLESDMVVAVWYNSKKEKSRPNARYLETITSSDSPYPVAFPLELIQKVQAWMYVDVAKSYEDIDNILKNKKPFREKPLLIPLPLAETYLGWDQFYIPNEYKNL